MTDWENRYRFLLGFLIEHKVLTDKRYNNGTWVLRGVYGVDDSGLRGAGRTPEEAVDNAIVASRLDESSFWRFWNETHEGINAESRSLADAQAEIARLRGALEIAEASRAHMKNALEDIASGEITRSHCTGPHCVEELGIATADEMASRAAGALSWEELTK